MAKRFQVKEGYEVRGMMIRLYPDREQILALESLQADCKRAWNWLCSQSKEVWEARKAYAVRNGLVPPAPVPPCYERMSSDDAKEAKKEFGSRCREWSSLVHAATKGVPACGYRKLSDQQQHFGTKWDYQLLTKVIEWRFGEEEPDTRRIKPAAAVLQALVKNFLTKIPGQRSKKHKKASDPMPLGVKSGKCFALGQFGSRGKNPTFYNCQVAFNGLKIRGRLPGKTSEGRVLEGVSITKKADGWWASIKQEVSIRQMPAPEQGSVVGLDVGLDNIVAMSDGNVVPNRRGKEFEERVAGRQATAAGIEDKRKRARYENTTDRLQQRAARWAKHTIYNAVVKRLETTEVIVVEKLPAHIGQMGSSKKSNMRMVVSMLRERYGDRVREVEPHYTSQYCSQCGKRSKESWSYEHGRIGHCPFCGYKADRDLNAARNVLAKYLNTQWPLTT